MVAGRKGQSALQSLPEYAKKYFAPLPYDTASGDYYKKLLEMSGHSLIPTKNDSLKKDSVVIVSMPPMGSFNLIMAQSLWDATMAYSISEYLKTHKRKKIVQVNGKFHSDQGFAIVTQLKKYSPSIKTLIISTASDNAFPIIDWSKYKPMGDYIIITDPKSAKNL